ncbi:hypothetical protein BHE74_00056334 [Ensete ventricosum]|nr:hypothetical protein BHE74_00056334 [Ensete ventricosum]RZS24774.1 hypothetical protein BHM03_00057881 [Ensete ventricosum]
MYVTLFLSQPVRTLLYHKVLAFALTQFMVQFTWLLTRGTLCTDGWMQSA